MARLIRVTAWTTVAILVLVIADIAFGIELPGFIRPALPFLLAGSLILVMTLFVGAYGFPKRPGSAGNPDQTNDDPGPS